MINRGELKVGDVVCTYNEYGGERNRNLVETTVCKVGSKWITVGSERGTKFDKELLYSDWGGYRLFLGNLEEANAYFEDMKRRREVIRRIEGRLIKLTSEELLEIERKINERE